MAEFITSKSARKWFNWLQFLCQARHVACNDIECLGRVPNGYAGIKFGDFNNDQVEDIVVLIVMVHTLNS